ncbi:hypothetical protein KAH81_10255 [bacterium]|nr:hypothetical protein [bacterium]
MNINIVNDQVIIELTEPEFEAFSAMFANLGANHRIIIEGLDWPGGSPHGGKYNATIKPMHLCRTIGEACAVESAGPLDIMSLYPFWKYGFCFGETGELRLTFTEIDPHKKANLSDEFGMGRHGRQQTAPTGISYQETTINMGLRGPPVGRSDFLD